MTFDVSTEPIRIEDAGPLRYLMSGDMIHGAQYLEGPRRRMPVPYFPSPGPVDELVAAAEMGTASAEPPGIGVVGLGTGGFAAHAVDGQRLVFWELDPDVVEAADEAFTYLAESPTDPDVVLGEGRRELGTYQGASFGLLVMDAFVGDGVPSHLLTREALALYRERIVDGGAIAFHASNKFIDLPALIANAARTAGLQVWRRNFDPRGDERYEDLFVQQSRWVVACPDGGGAADYFEMSPAWNVEPFSDDHPVWTDDEAADVELLR